MNRLKSEMAKRDAAIKKRENKLSQATMPEKHEKTLKKIKPSKQSKLPKEELPEYNLKGQTVTRPKKERKKRNGIIIGVAIAVILGVVYIPSLILAPFEDANNFKMAPDFAAIHRSSIYIQSNPNADWDDDGICNSEELMLGTNPYFIDSDNDGLSDYVELYTTNTSPVKSDKTLISYIQEQDNQAGNAVNTPYKLNDVILWADNMEAKAYGGVIRTRLGYRFCDFKGWVQFPSGKYAYAIKDGTHKLLEYREVENAWRIDGDFEVVLSDEPLEMVQKVEFFGRWKAYLPDNWFGKCVSAVLPSDNGIITCMKTAKKDTWADISENVTAPIKKIEYDSGDSSRFGKNQNALSYLAQVYQTIESGHSVLCSLFSPEYGETIVIVYGYTARGDLLVADQTSLEPIGTLQITEQIHRLMLKDGSIVRYEYFDFKGCGFDSETNKDRISFFAAATNDGEQDINLFR